MSSATAVTRSDFEQAVLESEVPVLVDFWATWCPPCRAIAPTVDAIAAEYQGKAKVVKLDIDEEPEIADRYGVHSIPTLIVFKNGRIVGQQAGVGSEQALRTWLQQYFAGPATAN